MPRRECGGCQGQGAHWRWCPQVVGQAASRFGQLSDQAESLGDQVGPNHHGAANHLWAAAGLLRELARERVQPGVPRDGSQDGRNPPPGGGGFLDGDQEGQG